VKGRKYKVEVKGRKCPVILHADTEDGGYWVECPSLPGCASQGDTVEEALEMIKDAIEGHLDVFEEDGKQMLLISVLPKLGTTEI
jgi:predicted RNase H-like HicB family nuclease